MAKKDPYYRRLNALGFLFCLAGLTYALITLQGLPDQNTQLSSHLASLAKLFTLCTTTVFFCALVQNPKTFGQRIYSLLNAVFIGAGISLMVNRLWTVAEPVDESLLSSCGIPFETMMTQYQGLPAKLTALFNSASICPVEHQQLLSLGITEQSLLFFLLLFLICWKILIHRPKTESLFL